jgi:hypothetical protein
MHLRPDLHRFQPSLAIVGPHDNKRARAVAGV